MKESSPPELKLTWRRKLYGVGIIVMVMLTATAIFSLTYLLTASIYRTTGRQPGEFFNQLINWVLGLIFCFSILYGYGMMIRGRRWRVDRNIFGPIFEAMAQIAKGDFNVSIDIPSPQRENPLMYELTRRINNMALELNQLETMRQEFISNVSHEIQSPLTSIRGFAQALQNDTLDATERAHYLTIIETESVRLSKLTDNLLKLASLEAEQVKFEPHLYRLDKQIRAIMLMAEPQWSEKSLQMDAELAEVTLRADEELLSQVWLNLIHNSIKFTPVGGKICVTLQARAGQAEVTITDTGVGIAAEDLAHIFERFYKADKARQRANGGSGLGLSIAQKALAMHDGTITATSQLGRGTTFTICLPLP